MDPHVVEVFRRHDRDRNDALEVTELATALTELEPTHPCTQQEALQCLKVVDANHSGTLTLEEFAQLFNVARLRRIFDDMDNDNSGAIAVKELSQSLRRVGIRPNQQQLQEMIRKLDIDHNGQIEFTEFYHVFKYVPCANLNRIGTRWASMSSFDVGTDLAPALPDEGISRVQIMRFLLAGGLGGIASRTVTAPLEKVKLQAQTTGLRTSSMFSELQLIAKEQGWRQLFAGNGANCLRVFPFGGIVCLTYASILRNAPDFSLDSSKEATLRAVAGGTAGGIATILTYPLDVVRAKVTVQNTNTSLFQVARSILQEQGVGGLFRGLSPTLMAVIPFVAFQQSLYDMMLKVSKKDLGISESPGLYMTCGALAGVGAQTIVFPLDLLRRRVQLGLIAHNHSTVQSLYSIYRQNGAVRSLFRGLIPTYAKVAPAVAVSITVRDLVKQYWTV